MQSNYCLKLGGIKQSKIYPFVFLWNNLDGNKLSLDQIYKILICELPSINLIWFYIIFGK